MSGRRRVVLNFHGIGEPPRDVPDDERPYWCPAGLWLQFADALADVHRDGRVDLVITFDDGNRSDVDRALPALTERGLRATFFPCAGRLGAARYLDADGLARLRAAGMGIGSHGWAHVDLRRADDATLERESRGSRARLEEASGGTVDEFAIPFGSYDRRVLRSLAHYRTLFSSDGGPVTRGRLVPRSSYVRGWEPDDIERLALAPFPAGKRLARGVRVLAKSLR